MGPWFSYNCSECSVMINLLLKIKQFKPLIAEETTCLSAKLLAYASIFDQKASKFPLGIVVYVSFYRLLRIQVPFSKFRF